MRIRTCIYQNKKFKITLTSTQQNNNNSLKYEEIWKTTNHEWLVLTIYQAGLLKFLKSRGAFWPSSEKLLWKHFTSLKLLKSWYNTFYDFNRNFKSKHLFIFMIWALFRMMWSFNNNFFCLTFKFFLCPKSTNFFYW